MARLGAPLEGSARGCVPPSRYGRPLAWFAALFGASLVEHRLRSRRLRGRRPGQGLSVIQIRLRTCGDRECGFRVIAQNAAPGLRIESRRPAGGPAVPRPAEISAAEFWVPESHFK